MNDVNFHYVVRGTVVALSVKGLAAALTFAFNILLARQLGSDATGLFILGATVVTITTAVTRCGMDNAVLRFVAVHSSADDWSSVRGAYRWGIGFPAIVSIVAAIATALVAQPMADVVFRKPALAPVLRVLAISIVPFVLVTLHGEAIKGLGKVFWSQITQGVVAPLIMVVTLLWVVPKTPQAVAIIYDVAMVGGALVGLTVWNAFMYERPAPRRSYSPRTLFRTAWPLLWVSSIVQIMGWTAVLLLGVWGSVADVAVFGIAIRVALATSVLLRSVSSVIAPRFAELFSKGDHDELGKIARHSTLMIAVAATPVFLLFIGAPSLVMRLFGRDFAGGGSVLAILAVGQFVNVVTGTVADLLMMTGHEKLVRNSLMWAGAINLALCCILIPRFGAIGAAIATSISITGLNIGQMLYVHAKLNIWTIPFVPAPKRGTKPA